ncbi:MAG: hypothetical protein EB084_15000 [Proteobacteria bacterium]|nr:hypothetical protein [Pseudomonadota bacterium]
MRELDSAQSQMEQEQAIRKVLLTRLRQTSIVQAPQQEIVAYRLAEIFVAARQLYTDVLPGFLELPEKSAPETAEGGEEVFEMFGDVRMHLLHLRDLVEDFEEAFLESLSGRLEAQEEGGEDAGDGDEG